MKTVLMTAAACAVLAGCGTAAAAHPVPRALTAAAVHLTPAQQRRECGALSLIQQGYGTYAREVQVVAGEYTVSQPAARVLIAAAIHDVCPADISVIPAG